MEEIQLSETEQRYFGDLFVCCDSDNSGKIPLYKASEFFRTANLPLDVVKQITELCHGGRPAGHLGRRQFYSALKLIAAFQAGLPLRADLFHAPIDVPLPHFTWKNPTEPWEEPLCKVPSPDLIQLTDSQPISKQDSISCELEGGMRTNGERASPSSTASDSPTPTNSVQDKGWQWAGGLEEQRRLLGTEEESSDRHSSDEDGDEEVWVISDEQRDYYTQQFRTLQPDLTGLIPGPAARTFLEKSRLPVSELRKVWQLSDVTRDGALSLDEFSTAMHLVVLRRNHIELPASLPSTLVPPPTAPPPMPPPGAEGGGGGVEVGGAAWTKFSDSPTGSASSPGPKPVSFDFRRSAVESDPLILHPVPLRVTPETQPPAAAAQATQQPCEDAEPRRNSDAIPYEPLEQADLRPIQRPTPKKPTCVAPGALPPPPDDHHVIAPPATGPASLPPAPCPKKEPPPPPPRPPHRQHARSSSLDLNRLGKSVSLLGAPPVVPPRVSPSSTSPKKLVNQRSEGDAGFSALGAERGEREEGGEGGPRRHGAFQVYRKPHSAAACDDGDEEDETDDPALPPGTSLRRLRAQNAVLARVCRDLHAELCGQREQRAALQLRLEALAASAQD